MIDRVMLQHEVNSFLKSRYLFPKLQFQSERSEVAQAEKEIMAKNDNILIRKKKNVQLNFL